MTFYQELQLNQAGSKAVVKGAQGTKEKLKHLAVYLFKILLTVSFCTVFVMGYGKIFGNDNNIVGVVILLCVLSFRFADLGIQTRDAMWVFGVIFAILAFGPRLANASGLVLEFGINVICILALLVLGCHNVLMFNHSTLVLGYLLLYGYDVSGTEYGYRLAAIASGAAITMAVYYRNHKQKTYKRGAGHLFREFYLASTRTRWQLRMTLAVATALLIAGLIGIPRRMWIGIAVMSVTMPFPEEMHGRVRGRMAGNLFGAVLFYFIYTMFPESMHSWIGIIGGIGVGLSAEYGWQAVFNSLGAMAIAVPLLGFPGAMFYRVVNNVIGAVYGIAFAKFGRCFVQKPGYY